MFTISETTPLSRRILLYILAPSSAVSAKQTCNFPAWFLRVEQKHGGPATLKAKGGGG